MLPGGQEQMLFTLAWAFWPKIVTLPRLVQMLVLSSLVQRRLPLRQWAISTQREPW